MEDADRQWYEQLAQHVGEHPPKCLASFQARRIPPMDDTWDDRTQWELSCACGSQHGEILGYPLSDFKDDYEGPLVFVTPLGFGCSQCRQVTEIIDTNQHGYDGECKVRFGSYGAATYRGTGKREAFACLKCGKGHFTAVASFQYSDFDLIEDEPELAPVAQDFFDWFECHGACVECGREQSFGDYELA